MRSRGQRVYRHPVNQELIDGAPLGARIADRVTGFMGSWTFIVIQTVIVALWVVGNIYLLFHFDPYPFIFLNLAFSTQAAYAAPLILLAQNRQENRDRVALEEDRRRAEQTKADTEYLARELAALRLAVGEVVTRDYLRRELEELRDLLNHQLPSKGGTGKKKRSHQAAQASDSPDSAEPAESDSGIAATGE